MDEVKSNADVELERMKYLKNFERQNNVEQIFNEGVSPVGKKIVELLKKEDMTYDSAYASLQYAYNLIRYESNFLKLN
ncbi:hypothetical protein LOOC260_114500 [Paucilactobacillus hokkaidonensis JCM 18461]|uniref:Uncharacterized protein n=2 Tax=Paucilactobacillus hokkaidonensis TaxID=1193095 RepID=A0A0A1GZT8_9LACO|nr:hypothetical protein [Paucilactobacillus hokkaidonensis]KRO06524.1 hypothetical protein IV59_GL002010 [Paucilactobacillus hokkaidonensis]BAP85494.1 hypothetical protein LOOC260_109550 [Paucilactobacillus hokkaidonensis JCM 18461]BAP85986.1 hypothetical protein LOOC260_114500 [Paucilactobacillus hokkaidonensis JCM 18461]